MEISDIFTHRVTVKGRHGLAAFILKGRSFATVRHSDVAHQIYRLKKIDGLKFAVFGAPGVILDPAKEQFCSTCEEIGCIQSLTRWIWRDSLLLMDFFAHVTRGELQ